MLTTIILATLFVAVTTIGVLSILKSTKKMIILKDNKGFEDYIVDTHKQEKIRGGILVGVGVVGLVMTGFMASKGSGGASSNFGFKFY